MEKLLNMLKNKEKVKKIIACIIILVVIFGGLSYLGNDMNYSDDKKNQLIEQNISQKKYQDAYNLNEKYFSDTERIHRANAEKINKCEDMQVTNIKDYESICNKIEILDQKVEYSNGVYTTTVKCKNNNENINLKNVIVEFVVEDTEKANQKTQNVIIIKDVMEAKGGQAIGYGKRDSKTDTLRYGMAKVIKCGSIVK